MTDMIMLSTNKIKFINIVENDGFGIALTGMFIVFIGLISLIVCISLLPKVLKSFEKKILLNPFELESPSNTIIEPQIIAVISAAIQEHRNK